mmetsp:Transcript_20690/g.42235  ORF Transcript_20690/g.42235 Transcript_20690/m.42235 type:complete len:84 (-) Transcript_20690:735-986(-)
MFDTLFHNIRNILLCFFIAVSSSRLMYENCFLNTIFNITTDSQNRQYRQSQQQTMCGSVGTSSGRQTNNTQSSMPLKTYEQNR